ncbi:MAG: hypothetical protein QG635_2382, partial [Bacteroidota bacterium]|nr:hypothetical protein [Bacteroidota bacterium]
SFVQAVTKEFSIKLIANPEITRQPEPQIQVQESKRLEISINSDGGQPLNYQWFKEGKEIQGAIYSIFRKASTELSDAGIYNCRVSNNCGDAYSEVCIVQVSQLNATDVPSSYRSNISLAVQPNPFGSAAEVIFKISHGNSVKLCLFDALGREMAVIADDYFEGGSHNIHLDAASLKLASGVYYLELKSKGAVCAIKVVVIN